ncbi:testis-specific serine/threonine-protein kinase 4-like [Melanaphis sacchari]|uniref:testis-specific serine/threonine-protein kinase 4-like n=1 Tax=Melanaphis sacchari TaxID=742174 RepID=UPI000DC145E0|nr:testis-specific serine/threonine-protein kinase 4-like [Melanaphis sacchari]
MLATSDSSFLGKHKLQVWKKIGEGSFSKVYLVKFGEPDDENAVMVATKVINKNRVSNKFVEKFLPRELDVLVKLKHPYIVKAILNSIVTKKYELLIGDEIVYIGD